MPRIDNDVLANRIARYGLPVLVLIFYIHAARFLEYTPDHGFIVPTYAAGLINGVGLGGPSWAAGIGTPSPLWALLLAAGGGLGIDLLLTAKIFGLFFGSLSVLATYLLAVEVFDDRILALCVALLVATGPWLMMASVAGDGITLALAVSLAGLFFHLRGDFLVGILMTALAGLILWPALILGALCVLDDLRRASTPSERRRRGTTGGLLLFSILALWGLLAWRLGAGPVPLPTGGLTAMDPVSTASLVLFAGTGLVIIANAIARGRIAFGHRSVLPLALLWSVIAILTGLLTLSNALFLAYPLLTMAAFLGMVFLFPQQRADGWLRLGPVFALTAMMLLANQAGLYFFTRPTLLAGAVELAQLESAASWVRTSASAGTRVASDRPWTVSYLAGGIVSPYAENSQTKPDLVVLSRGELPGYFRAYRAPLELGPAGVELAGEVSVWKKSGE